MKVLLVFLLVAFIIVEATHVRTLVGLKQNVAQAEEVLMEISNPQSGKYAQYLTLSQIGEVIGASQQQIDSVVSFLESQGGHSIEIFPTKDWIQVELPTQIANRFEKSIPKDLKDKVDYIQVSHKLGKQLHIHEQENHLAVEFPESAPKVLLHQSPQENSIHLWIIPNGKLQQVQKIQVRLETFESNQEIPPIILDLTPGENFECSSCENLVIKPWMKSGDLCGRLVENRQVCLAKNLRFDLPTNLESINPLWKLASRIQFSSGSWSEQGWFSGLTLTGSTEEFAAPFEFAVKLWDPNSQKAQYQQSTTLTGTSGLASQIVWGTGSYGYSDSDLSQFYSTYSIPTNSSYVSPLGEAGNSQGDNWVEAQLDIQYVSAFGPQITSACVNTDNSTSAEGSTGFGSAFLEFTTQINTLEDPPLVISLSLGSLSWQSCNILCTQAANQGASSYSDCLTYVQSQFQVCMYSSADQVSRINNELMKMGMNGVSVFGAAGDGGNHFSFGAFKPFGADAQLAQTLNEISCEYTLPTFPAASPWITAVGATQMQGNSPNYYPIGCSTQTGGGITGGCGFSWQFAMPDYQQTVVENYLNTFSSTDFGNFNASGRAYPDISGIGSSIPIINSGVTMLVDGTSCSTPTVAGIFSLINDNRLQNGLAPLGFINTRLYQSAATQASSLFVDVTQGSSKCGIGICCDTGFVASAGWDVFTGWGNPLFPGLLDAFST